MLTVTLEIAEALSTSTLGIECAQVECVGNPDIVRKFSVQAYPTVVLCYASGEFKIYHGVPGRPLEKDA